MADYRTPLPALLAGAMEAAVNRVLALDPSAAGRVDRLEGRLLQLDLEGLGITLFFTFAYGSVQVSLDAEGEADTVVSGTPAALFSMAAPEEVSSWGLPGSGVRISGDAGLARDLGKLFEQLDPDWEAPLSAVLGDTLGFQVSTGLARGARALREAAKTTAEFTAQYLRDESGLLVEAEEVREFGDAVERLRDGVGRLDARLRRLEERDK
ncbi:MAG: SCP2 sterol-binding domain-containing protein [Gammaproteobacteria bacterium]